MLHRIALSTALALGAVACEAPPEPTVRTAIAPAPDQAAAADGPVTAVGKPSRRAVAPEAAARLAPQAVVWPARGAIDAEVRGRFAEADRRLIDASPLPVLAPREPRAFGRAKVVARPAWFSVAVKDAAYAAELDARRAGRSTVGLAPGIAVFVQGSRVVHRHPGIAPVEGNRTLRGRPAWITQNEAIWSATWEENGVTYVVELECSRPSDPRCANDQQLVEVAESLAFVGGAGPVAPPAAPANGGAR
jgi:hypothetical protein